ncbi:CocE/NonD family hydrolase [Candidatus Neomarinimicrobiota bacterium]
MTCNFGEVGYWRDWLAHNSYDSYWNPMTYLEDLESLEIPVLIQSGWFDGGTKGTQMAYERLQEGGNRNVRMIIGPWTHSDRGGRYLEGQDMGEEADIDLFDLYGKWFDYWLKDIDNNILDIPPVQTYLMNSNDWLTDTQYPLSTTLFTPFFLGSSKSTISSNTQGTLTTEFPISSAEYDSYSYNPAYPTPSFYAFLKRNALEEYMRVVDHREDLISYETNPLNESIDIAGPLVLVLYASSSAIDTDWFATLYGIDQLGQPYPLGVTFGMLRARYRDSYTSPDFLVPEEVYPYTIELAHTAITIPAGHRLRLDLSSASFPEYSRNLNTGGHNEMDEQLQVASQKIFHTEEFPSHLLLPIMKSDSR